MTTWIELQIDPEALFPDDDPDIDPVASFAAYMAEVEDGIRASYPQADLTVTTYPRQGDHILADPDVRDEIFDIRQKIWNDGAFWVLAEK